MKQLINSLLPKEKAMPLRDKGIGKAPINIALCKYWGKRDINLNLPATSSLSISLSGLETITTIKPATYMEFIVNGNQQSLTTNFGNRLAEFLKNFISKNCQAFHVTTNTTVPIAAGLASSAAGFAALVKALDNLFAWQLSNRCLSILARLGSGSAARSIFPGFVIWHKGCQKDGLDSFAEPIDIIWPELRVGLAIIAKQEKNISSRLAMANTAATSPFYKAWLVSNLKDFDNIKNAIYNKDFHKLGSISESNSLAMHATMLAARPAIKYSTAATITLMERVWHLRNNGIQVYFTQDAGPNLKLLFLASQQVKIMEYFPELQIIAPFKECYA